MKTAEEKANEYLDKISGDSLGSPINAAYSGFIAGYNEAMRCQSNPKIKQLEWEVHGSIHEVHGSIHYVNQYNPIGYTACITEWNLGKKDYSVRLGLNDSNNSTKFFNSIDEAKDFVQKDFEARVKECLIIE